MHEKSNDYQICINVALDNADKKSVLEEYKEWINNDLNNYTVLLLREDPII